MPDRSQIRSKIVLKVESPSGRIWIEFFEVARALSSILDHFGSDFGPYWDRFWIHNWFQKHEKVQKFKVSLGYVQPKLRPSLDQV